MAINTFKPRRFLSIRFPRQTVWTKVLYPVVVMSLIGAGVASAQTQQQADKQTSDYFHYIKPQLDRQAAETAEILNRPANWGPGEIRDAVNYGALAWYEKSPGKYGYVFNQGSIRDISASLNVDIECTQRRITCEGKLMVMNEWLVIGSYKNRMHYAAATGPTRAAAEATVKEQCRKDGTTCTIKDAFAVLPHRRGVSHQRQMTVVR
jgi:hypothetical protein